MTPNPPAPAAPEAERALGLARALARLGRVDRALEQYDVFLAHRPWSPEVIDEALDLLATRGDVTAVERRCAEWLVAYPDHATHDHAEAVHTRRIDALIEWGGIDAAFAVYGLSAASRTDATIDADEIVALVGVRNEAARLEWFLRHHRSLGVDRFLVVDNGSDDGSAQMLAAQPDVVLWHTTRSYRAANCGAVWWDLLARRHLADQWSLIVDADELFAFPGSETRSLRDLTAELDRAGATTYRAIMVDLYGTGPQSSVVCAPGQNPLEVFDHFDADWYRIRVPYAGPRRNLTNYWGGVRSRVFGGGLGGHLLDKVPLRRARPGERVWSGNHWCDRPTSEITGRGALLHVKYGSRFAAAVAAEAERGEHAGGARVYTHAASGLAENPDPDFFAPAHSVRYTGTDQLLRLGICRPLCTDARIPVAPDGVHFPPVPPVSTDGGGNPEGTRPLWSVVVLADDATNARVADALAALADTPASEVVVVTTGDSPAFTAAPVPGGRHRIREVRTPTFPTAPGAANLGLAASEGTWVHVVGPGWTVTPHAYRALAAALAGAPTSTMVVAAPSTIALDLAAPSVSLAARRELLERSEGFCVMLGMATTWELAQRAASRTAEPIVTISEPLGRAVGDVSGPAGYGTDVARALAAIDLAAAHGRLDPATVARLHARCADLAAELISQDVAAGRMGSALAVVAECARAPFGVEASTTIAAALNAGLR